MDITDRAYVAGFFDADGCVSIGRNVDRHGTIRHALMVIFSQRDRAFLEGLRRRLDLGVGSIQGSNGVHSLVFQGGGSGTALLQQLIPFLCIKREQAELAVQFKTDDALWERYGPRRTPAHVIEKRDVYKEALSGLKAKRQVILPDPVPIGPLTNAECAYLAGFIDGDGCISVTKHNRKDTPVPAYDLWLVIAQGNGKAFFEYWRERTGVGSVLRTRRAGMRTKFGDRHINCTQDHYHWRIASKAAEGLLRKVGPFLRLKKEQAELALRFRSTFARRGGRGGYAGTGKTAPAVIEERERCKLALSYLR